MIYLSWAVLYEGNSDASYFDILIPRILEELALTGVSHPTIPLAPAIRLKRADAGSVAREACEASAAFQLVFIHADVGGRGLGQNIHRRGLSYCEEMNKLCDWPTKRCIVIAPRHETEAWILADPQAVIDTFGFKGNPNAIGLPPNPAAAERLVDPKAALLNAASCVRGRRKSIQATQLYPAIAQRQRLEELRKMDSYRIFEGRVRVALDDIHVI